MAKLLQWLNRSEAKKAEQAQEVDREETHPCRNRKRYPGMGNQVDNRVINIDE